MTLKISEVILMKSLAILLMLCTWQLATITDDLHRNVVDMDSGLIVVKNGEAHIDNQQYYVGHFGEPR